MREIPRGVLVGKQHGDVVVREVRRPELIDDAIRLRTGSGDAEY
jgi:hypothetical protein